MRCQLPRLLSPSFPLASPSTSGPAWRLLVTLHPPGAAHHPSHLPLHPPTLPLHSRPSHHRWRCPAQQAPPRCHRRATVGPRSVDPSVAAARLPLLRLAVKHQLRSRARTNSIRATRATRRAHLPSRLRLSPQQQQQQHKQTRLPSAIRSTLQHSLQPLINAVSA